MLELFCVVTFKFPFETPLDFPVLNSRTNKIKFTNGGRTCLHGYNNNYYYYFFFYLSGHLSSIAATLPKKEQINKLELRRFLPLNNDSLCV